MESLDIPPPKNDGNEIPGMVVQTVTSIVGLPESMEVNVHPSVARDQRPTLQIGTPVTVFDCDFPQHSLFAPSTPFKGGNRRMVRIPTSMDRTEHYLKTVLVQTANGDWR